MSNVSPKTIKSAVEAARQRPSTRMDPRFAQLHQARVGTPAQVYSPEGRPEFWLVPLLVDDLACGIATVDLEGSVTRLGILGASSEDRASWIPASYFAKPPERYLDEIRETFGSDLSAPFLAYDVSPARWAWLVNVMRAGRVETRVFISPSGWYERGPGSARPDYAG